MGAYSSNFVDSLPKQDIVKPSRLTVQFRLSSAFNPSGLGRRFASFACAKAPSAVCSTAAVRWVSKLVKASRTGSLERGRETGRGARAARAPQAGAHRARFSWAGRRIRHRRPPLPKCRATPREWLAVL